MISARAWLCLAVAPALMAQQTQTGDPQRGKALFEGKGQCVTCHRVNGAGSRWGPDLSQVGEVNRAPTLERALLDPNAEVRRENRYVRLVLKNDGTEITGQLLNSDVFSVQFRDRQDKLRSLSRSDLNEVTVLTESLMPSYRDRLSSEEIADLVAYLLTLQVAREETAPLPAEAPSDGIH